MTVPKSTPTEDQTREQLMAQWREARRQREAATPGSVAYRRALEEIARIERAMVPPRA